MSEPFSFRIPLGVDYEAALQKVTAALEREGFGVLTEIDVRETLRDKLGEEFRRYAILGACNPPLAHRALENEPQVGLMLPCNVTVEETDSGSLVSLLNPQAMLKMDPLAESESVRAVAAEAEQRLRRVADALRSS